MLLAFLLVAMIPLLGTLVWGLAFLFGLGAVIVRGHAALAGRRALPAIA